MEDYADIYYVDTRNAAVARSPAGPTGRTCRGPASGSARERCTCRPGSPGACRRCQLPAYEQPP